MHICHEEVFAIIQAIPGLRLAVPYLKMKWHEWRGCHKKHTGEDEDAVSKVQS